MLATRCLFCRHQAHVPATPRSVWELVGQPNRHPEWWPEVVEVQGKRFGRGCEYCHVAREAAESDPDFDPVRSKNRLRHWLESSLDGLTEAVPVDAPP
jgi:hypothetical protein